MSSCCCGRATPPKVTEGPVVNHVAFRVQSLASLQRAGFDVQYNKEYPGVASVFSPQGERIELTADLRDL